MQMTPKMLKKAKELFPLWRMLTPIPTHTCGYGSGMFGAIPVCFHGLSGLHLLQSVPKCQLAFFLSLIHI